MRLAKHKSLGINPIEDVVVLFASYDRKEANRVERFYHSIGYKGRGKSKQPITVDLFSCF